VSEAARGERRRRPGTRVHYFFFIVQW
jgi:hypothetical protein